ncbi:MAG: ATP-grasp protein [Frankiales bacterium]|nr:ATP-grasp protein [Frankiales bacterium]
MRPELPGGTQVALAPDGPLSVLVDKRLTLPLARAAGVRIPQTAGGRHPGHCHGRDRREPDVSPPWGCATSRETVPLTPDLRDASHKLIQATGLEGYAELELRRDAEGRLVLMEVNPRLSAAVEVAVRAGVDFPLLLQKWANGEPSLRTRSYRTGVSVRWLGGDLAWLTAVGRPGRPESLAPRHALIAFARDFGRRTSYDYLDISDPAPALAALLGSAQDHVRNLRAGTGWPMSRRTVKTSSPQQERQIA